MYHSLKTDLRFNGLSTSSVCGLHLLPKKFMSLISHIKRDLINECCTPFLNTNTCTQDVGLCKQFWEERDVAPPKPYENLGKSVKDVLPLLTKVIKLPMLIPVTAATVERAHSWLKFANNHLCSTTTKDDLNGLM